MRFGGVVMRGLAGALGGYNEAADAQRDWDLKQAELNRRLADDTMQGRDRDEARQLRSNQLRDAMQAKLTARFEKSGIHPSQTVMDQYTASQGLSEIAGADDPYAGMAQSVWNAARAAGQSVPQMLQTEGMSALSKSTQQGGVPVAMPRGLGYVEDPDKEGIKRVGYAKSIVALYPNSPEAADIKGTGPDPSMDYAVILSKLRQDDLEKKREARADSRQGRTNATQDRQKERERLDTGEAWFNVVVGDQQQGATPEATRAVNTFNRLRRANPTWTPQRIMAATKDALAATLKSANTESTIDARNPLGGGGSTPVQPAEPVSDIQAQADDAITQITASGLSADEKARRIAGVRQKLASLSHK